MLAAVRSRLSYANVVATMALFIALGGTGYAALTLPAHSVGSRQLKPHAVSSSKVKRNSLTGSQIKESTLGEVPRAVAAKTLGSLTAAQIAAAGAAQAKLRCPTGTVGEGGVCIETAQRPGSSYDAALLTCFRVGRQLPSVAQLVLRAHAGLASGTELTGEVKDSATAFAVNMSTTGITTLPVAGASSYRCVGLPSN